LAPPEESAQVQGLGAHWDAESKRWYIEAAEARDQFSRWLASSEAEADNEEFSIVSSKAYVAPAMIQCRQCGVPQDDPELPAEPDAPFFDIPAAAPGSIQLTALHGTVRLSGDEHFTIES